MLGSPVVTTSFETHTQELLLLTFPPEVLGYIASYLTVEELEAFKLICSHFRGIAQINSLWIPFLNRLKALMPDMAPIAETASYRAHFIENFERLAKRQMREIRYFQALIAQEEIECPAEITQALKEITKPASKLKTLEARERLLDKINLELIYPLINVGSVELDLSHLGITRLPEALFTDEKLQGFWSKLTDLILDGNHLRRLPEGLGTCVALECLSAYANKLRALPKSLAKCQVLEHLTLYSNQLQSLPDYFDHFKQLKWLEVGANKLTCLPTTLGQCKELVGLDVGGNYLITLGITLEKFKKLEVLNISNNKISDFPDIIKCQNLRTFDISDNRFIVLPDVFDKLENLRKINASSNYLRLLPKFCETLENVDVSDNQLEQLPLALCKLTKLKVTENKLQDIAREFKTRFGARWYRNTKKAQSAPSIEELKPLKTQELSETPTHLVRYGMYLNRDLGGLDSSSPTQENNENNAVTKTKAKSFGAI